MSNLLTRGLSRIKQTVVVRGLLGGIRIVVAPGGPGSASYYNEYMGEMLGNQRWMSETFDLVGAKEFEVAHEAEVIGHVQTDLEKSIDVIGQKSSEFVLESIVFGYKQFDRSELMEMCGSRSLSIFESTRISGQRQTHFQVDHDLFGTRTCILNENMHVTGKRDLTPILILTDII